MNNIDSFLPLTLATILLFVSYAKIVFLTKNVNPIFLVFILFSVCYLVIGETYFVPADNFSKDVYTKSALISLSSAMAVFFASIFFSTHAALENSQEKDAERSLWFLRLSYVGLFVIGYVFLLMNYQRFDGVLEFFEMGTRQERNYEMRVQRGNYPFSTILYCGFIVSIVTEFVVAKTKGSFSYPAVFCLLLVNMPCLLLYIVDGDRTSLLKYCIAAAVLATFDAKANKRLIKFAIIGLGLLGLISVLGSTRTITNKVIAGDFQGAKHSLNLMVSKFPRSLFPNEFAAINSTTHFIISSSPDLIFGSSYLASISHPIPRSILKVDKPVPIADQLASKWALELFTLNPECRYASNKHVCNDQWEAIHQKRKKFSTSISPVAEALWNFGIAAPALAFFVFACFFIWLDKVLRSASALKIAFALGMSFLALAIHRSAFAGVFTFGLYILVFVMLPLYFSHLVSKLGLFSRK